MNDGTFSLQMDGRSVSSGRVPPPPLELGAFLWWQILYAITARAPFRHAIIHERDPCRILRRVHVASTIGNDRSLIWIRTLFPWKTRLKPRMAHTAGDEKY